MLLRLLCVGLLLSLAWADAPFYLSSAQLGGGTHHQRHEELLADSTVGYNGCVLRAIDKVQASAPEGGGYFTGVKAVPAESPIGYGLQLLGAPLLAPPRTTSYCSGSSYAVLVEALNALYPGRRLDERRLEGMRMQEPDGGRREDRVKAWGWWNADGYGSQFCLVQYLGLGEEVAPRDALPGDFVNISWKSGNGHSVVFLGYSRDEQDGLRVSFFSSQASTQGLADHTVSADLIEDVKFVRLTHPERLFTFEPGVVQTEVPKDHLDF
ncbi:MAG: hypothetical protein J0I12_30795 [Candidatus Eremiobacteraeota bacterium]|nr:hypothetical protein [Candidatus Eremiobacteraeota bacterium]